MATSTRFPRRDDSRQGSSGSAAVRVSLVGRSKGSIRLRPGAGLRPGPSLRPGSRPQNAVVKIDQGPKLKDQSGPRKQFTLQELLSVRETYRELPKNLPHITLVTGLGLGLQDDVPDSWDDVVAKELTRIDVVPLKSTYRKEPTASSAKESISNRKAATAASKQQQAVSSQVKESVDAAGTTPAAADRTNGGSVHVEEKKHMEATQTTVPSQPSTSSKPAWRPSKGLSPMEKLEKKVKGILNKVTVDKFESLSEQLCHLIKGAVTNASQVQRVVSLIFDKAVDEAEFVKMYADLCVKVNEDAPDYENPQDRDAEKQRPSTFLRNLVTQCQTRFQKGAIDLPKPPEMSDEDYEYLQVKQKKHLIGNINFIGELFIVRLIKESVVHACIQYLFRSPDPTMEDLDQLCNLLTTTGKELDKTKHPKYKSWLDDCFLRLKNLANRTGQDSRVKFMIYDVIDLRDNNWVPRQEKLRPQKLDELHQEAEQQKILGALMSGSKVKQPLDDRYYVDNGSGISGASGRDRLLPHLVAALPSDIGGGAFKIEDEDSPFSSFKGSFVRYEGRNSAKMAQDRSNMSQIGGQDEGSTANFSQNFGLLPSRKPQTRITPQTQTRDEGDVEEEELQAEDVDEDNAENSFEVVESEVSDQSKKKKDEIIAEYFETEDLTAAENAFAALNFGTPSQIVADLIRISIDRHERERELATTLISCLLDRNMIVVQNIKKVLKEWMEFFSDQKIDLPKISEYLGGIFGRLLLKDSIRMKFFISSLKLDPEIKDERNDEHLVADVLSSMINASDVETVKSLLLKTNLLPEDFISGDSTILDTLKSNNLDVLFASRA